MRGDVEQALSGDVERSALRLLGRTLSPALRGVATLSRCRVPCLREFVHSGAVHKSVGGEDSTNSPSTSVAIWYLIGSLRNRRTRYAGTVAVTTDSEGV